VLHNNVTCHIIELHDNYGKIVYRLCSSCISSIQEINENFIKFFLSIRTESRFELSWLKSYSLCITFL